jgi:hypothetical protein
VKKHLGKEAKFFIAGGSCFGEETGKDYNDIDVWFYSEKDFKKTSKNITAKFASKNAVSIDSNIQLIVKNFGNPEEIMSMFDLKCCKIGITSDYEIFRAEDYTTDMKIEIENISYNTLLRYVKYYDRGVPDKELTELKKFIDYIVLNPDMKKDCPYGNGKLSLVKQLRHLHKLGDDILKYLDFKVKEVYNNTDTIVRILRQASQYGPIVDISEEWWLSRNLFRINNIRNPNIDVVNKYPEFFI